MKDSAENQLVAVLRDTLGIVISPLKKVLDAKADSYIERKKVAQKFELEKIDLVGRAKMRLFETEVRRQYNLEEIGKEAIKLLPPTAKPKKIDLDWLHHFSASAQDVNEPTLRLIWARLLTEEATKPGQFSRRTLDVLKNFSRQDCALFEKLSQYLFTFENHTPCYLSNLDYGKTGDSLSYEELLHLGSIGLLEYDINTSFSFEPQEKGNLIYWDKKIIVINSSKKGKIYLPAIYTTRITQELLKIINKNVNEKFFNQLLEYFKSKDLSVQQINSD